jgi:hypothetical protein
LESAGVGGSITLPHGHFKLSTLAVLRDLARLANSASSLASSSGVRSRFTGQQYNSAAFLSSKSAYTQKTRPRILYRLRYPPEFWYVRQHLRAGVVHVAVRDAGEIDIIALRLGPPSRRGERDLRSGNLAHGRGRVMSRYSSPIGVCLYPAEAADCGPSLPARL